MNNQEENTFDNILFPTIIKVAARTISQDLIFASKEEIKEIEYKIKIENRSNKIDSIVEGKDYDEKKLEDDEEYKKLMKKGVTPMSAASPLLFYIDYVYNNEK